MGRALDVKIRIVVLVDGVLIFDKSSTLGLDEPFLLSNIAESGGFRIVAIARVAAPAGKPHEQIASSAERRRAVQLKCVLMALQTPGFRILGV